MAKQPAPPRSLLLRFEACALTHQGKLRPKHEDAFVLGTLAQSAQITAAVITEKTMEADGSIAAVIDGMGGMGGGDVAATWLAQRWAKRRVSSKATLKRQLCRDHEELNDEAQGSPTPFMGAVATGVALLPEHALLFHVGDCRAYQIKGHTCTLLTTDDVGESGSITQAFGGRGYPIEPHLINLPYDPESTLLLMSDGAWDYLKPGIISLTLGARPKLREFVLTLAALILEGRAHDNLTIMALRMVK